MSLRLVGVLGLAVASCAGAAPLAPLPQLPHVPSSASQVTASAAAAPSSLPTAPRVNSTPPLAANPEPPGALPAVSQGDIGEAGTVQVLAASKSGAWVALCGGEPRSAKLVLGAGSGEPITDLLAQDPSGRYVVVQRAGVTELVDATGGARVDLSALGADVRRLRTDYAEHRAFSFDPSGRYLSYLRKQAGPPQIVLRDLQAGSEQTFAPGAGDVLSVRLSADARHISFEALREDTNHNGKLDFPTPEEAPRNVCDQPKLPRFRSFAYQGRGDAAVRGVVELGSGAVRDVPELVTPLGASLLLRSADGALLLDKAGKRTPLSPASCAARVLFADAERGLVLANCAPPPPKKVKGRPAPQPSGKRELWLFGAGLAKQLPGDVYDTAVDRDGVVGTRLVPLYPGAEAWLLDLERRESLALPAGSRVLATHGSLALVWRENDLYRYDAQTKSEQRLARGVAKNPDLLQSGPSVLLSPFVVVAVSAPALESPRDALALTSGGIVLTGSSDGDGTSRGAIQGPLHWVDARLPPPDGPSR